MMNKEYQVVLIGAGQLGSRHLQGLARLQHPARITVIDPSAKALEVCRERVAEIEGWNRHTYSFQMEMNDLQDADVAIIATNADVRRTVIETLLSTIQVRYMLLEKVLFQRVSDCIEVGRLLNERGVKAWVNAPRPMWKDYQALKAALAGDRIRSFRTGGAEWKMASNAYHMLDLYGWLLDDELCWLHADEIDQEPVPAPRAGFYELHGSLSGRFSGGCYFSMSDHAHAPRNLYLLIETEARLIYLSEKERRLCVVSGDPLNEAIDEKTFNPEYQSGLTHLAVEDIMQHERCALTPYQKASSVHELLLRTLGPHFKGLGKDDDICPIT